MKVNPIPQKYTYKVVDRYFGNNVIIISAKSILTQRLKKPVLYTLPSDVITTKLSLGCLCADYT